MKRLLLFIICIFTACSLAGCNGKNVSDKTSEISITSGDIEIPFVMGLNKWEGAFYDREDTFQTIMKGDSKNKLPYIKQGEKIQIVFKGKMPDTVSLKEYILTEDGNVKYTDKEVKEIPITFEDKKGEFDVLLNFAAFLSSNSKDYEPGALIRGYRLVCSWGENECEYGFIIRTDAN